MRWPAPSTLNYGSDGLGVYLPGANEWKFPRLHQQGVQFRALHAQKLSAGSNAAGVYRASDARQSMYRQSPFARLSHTEFAPYVYVPYHLMKQTHGESFELESGFAYDPNFDSLVNFESDKILYALQDGNVCTGKLNFDSKENSFKFKQTYSLSVPGLVYDCHWIEQNKFLARTPSKIKMYNTNSPKPLFEFDMADFEQLTPPIAGPELIAPVFADYDYKSSNGSLTVADSHGNMGIYNCSRDTCEKVFSFGDFGVEIADNDWVSSWIYHRWDPSCPDGIIAANRRNILQVDLRQSHEAARKPLPLEPHALVCDIYSVGNESLYCLTNEKLKWFDLRNTSSPLLEWKHGLHEGDSGLKISYFPLPHKSRGDGLAIYSELRQVGATLFQFGIDSELPVSLNDPICLDNLSPSHGPRSMAFYPGPDSGHVVQCNVNTAGELWAQAWTAQDSDVDMDVDFWEADTGGELHIDDPKDDPTIPDHKRYIPRLLDEFLKLFWAPENQEMSPASVQQLGEDLNKKISELYNDSEQSRATLASGSGELNLLETQTFDPELVLQLIAQLQAAYADTDISIEFRHLATDLNTNDLPTYLKDIWELDPTTCTQVPEWFVENRKSLIPYLTNLLLMNLTLVSVGRSNENESENLKISGHVEEVLAEWEPLQAGGMSMEDVEHSLMESQLTATTQPETQSQFTDGRRVEFSQTPYFSPTQVDEPEIASQASRSSKRHKKVKKKRKDGFV